MVVISDNEWPSFIDVGEMRVGAIDDDDRDDDKDRLDDEIASDKAEDDGRGEDGVYKKLLKVAAFIEFVVDIRVVVDWGDIVVVIREVAGVFEDRDNLADVGVEDAVVDVDEVDILEDVEFLILFPFVEGCDWEETGVEE